MHGGVKVYRGAPAAARHYVEADRSRADDYYLAEGTGIAQRFTRRPDRAVSELAPLTGDGYEAWVAGLDPDTGEPRGRLRARRAARCGSSRSWSTARSPGRWPPRCTRMSRRPTTRRRTARREQIIGWLAEHATTRVGPRGAQVQVPVEQIEAVTVRHYTSRAGDPHRHLHLQVNARVFADGKWRGLHTVGFRDSHRGDQRHRARRRDVRPRLPGRARRARVTPSTRRPARSSSSRRTWARSASGPRRSAATSTGTRPSGAPRIPGQEPGPALRRAWDARAWADARPDKVIPRRRRGAAAPVAGRAARRSATATATEPAASCALPMAGAPGPRRGGREVLARLGARRSAWNAADIRGEVEQLLAATGLVADAAVRLELAEDLTARAVARVRAAARPADVPEHVRALTSRTCSTSRPTSSPGSPLAREPTASTPSRQPRRPVGEGLGRRAARGGRRAGRRRASWWWSRARPARARPPRSPRPATHSPAQGRPAGGGHPDAEGRPGRRREVGRRGPGRPRGWSTSTAGAGTTTARWTRMARPTDRSPARAGRSLRRVTCCWSTRPGCSTRTPPAPCSPSPTRRGARVALVGDRHQLPAVGRGGVLDLAAPLGPPRRPRRPGHGAPVRRTVGRHATRPDTEYAALTPGDARAATTRARCSTRLHAARPGRAPRQRGRAQRGARRQLAADALDGRRAPRPVVADTREQAAALNAAIRDRLVAAGPVDDTPRRRHPRRAADRRRRPGRDPPQRPRPRRGQP